MALSGSFNTANYDGRYLKFSWTATQSIANNTSTISWKVEGAGDSASGANWYMTGPVQVVISGATVYSSSTRFKLYKGTTVASGTTKIEHNPDGSKSFSASVKAAIYESSYNKSGSGSWTLDNIPRAATITTAPDFNDEENPTITYSNLLGNSIDRLSVCISLTGAKADIPYRDVEKNSTSYTFNLTEEERNILRAAVTSGYTTKVYFYVRTIMNEEFYYNKLAKTFTIINGEPKISPVIEEANTSIAPLTGSTSAFIENASIINYAVNPSVSKGATIKSISVQYGNYKGTTATGSISNITSSGDITFTLTDSRNNKATKKIAINVLRHRIPYAQVLEETLSTTATEVFVDVRLYWSDIWLDGTANGSGGGAYNEGILKFRYKLQDEEFGEWMSVDSSSYEKQGDFGFYLCQLYINELDSLSTYTVQVALTDMFYDIDNENLDISEFVVKMMPVFDWGKDDFAVNVPLNINDKVYLKDEYIGENKEIISQEMYATVIGGGNLTAGASITDLSCNTYLCGKDISLRTTRGGTVMIYNGGPLYQDMVLEQGNDGSYAYRRWQSGLMEAWRIATTTVSYDITKSYGSTYYSSDKKLNTSGNASQFVFVQSVQLTIDKRGANGLPGCVVIAATTSSGQVTVNYLVTNPVSGTFSFCPNVYIVGRWK